jgi:hypothetical protein
MLLILLRQELRAVLHQSPPSWLSTLRTGGAIQKTTRSMASSPGIWKRFSPDSVNAIAVEVSVAVIWESETASNSEVSMKESEYIRRFKSNDPAVGYNRSPRFKVASNSD